MRLRICLILGSAKLVIAHININSLRNKFELLTEKIKENVDMLLISETKIDENFPDSQFKIDGFSNPPQSRPQRKRRRNYAVI